MRKRLFALISLLIFSSMLIAAVHSDTVSKIPVLYVDPPSILDTTKTAGTQFSVNINIKDVKDLFVFDFRLNYSASVLDLTATSLGSFLPADSFIAVNDTDRTAGSVRFLISQPLGAQTGSDGSGTLIRMNFTVLSSGVTTLRLCKGSQSTEAFAWDSHTPIRVINVKVYDGYFRNTPGSKLTVRPENVTDPTLVPGQTLVINVSVSNVVDLHRAEFGLSYDSSLLNVTDVVEGDFLKGAGSTEFSFNANRTLGDLQINITLTEPTFAISGNGPLVKITFNVTDLGDCLLYLHNTNLVRPDLTPIDHAGIEGIFNNNPVIHDVAIIKVATTISETKIVDNVPMIVSQPITSIESGKHVNVTVTVKNNGTLPETVDVTAYYDDIQISRKNGTAISRGTSATLTIDWSTEGVGTGNHSVWAEVTTVAGETNVANNKLTMVGDFLISGGGTSVPLPFIVAGVGAVVAVLLIGVYFFRFRKAKSDET